MIGVRLPSFTFMPLVVKRAVRSSLIAEVVLMFVFAKIVQWLRLSLIPHPKPYRVSSIDSSSISVSQRCQGFIAISLYKDHLV